MNVTMNEVGAAQSAIDLQKPLGYKTVWCRLENGGYWMWRSRLAHVADRLVSEYNKVVQPGRRYYAFPEGFNANVLGTHDFSLVVVQSIEDHLLSAGNYKYRRIKEQVAELATTHHGMTKTEVEAIEREFTAAYKLQRGNGGHGTGD